VPERTSPRNRKRPANASSRKERKPHPLHQPPTPPSDDLSHRLRDLLQIKDRRKFQHAVLAAVMPCWVSEHPDRPGVKGGAPKLSRQRVREAWEKVYGELGLQQFLMLEWQELVGHMKRGLGRIKKGKKHGTFYSESAIKPHLQECISATLGPGIPDANLRKLLRGNKKKWFSDLKEWISRREAITPNSAVNLSALHGPAWEKVLHGNAFEAMQKDDLTAIQNLYRHNRRPTDR
jgi:hypothetical protein